jgi:hypothetical protein
MLKLIPDELAQGIPLAPLKRTAGITNLSAPTKSPASTKPSAPKILQVQQNLQLLKKHKIQHNITAPCFLSRGDDQM